MRSPLPQLTTFLLLVHLGLGCCLHHAHACEGGRCALETSSADACEAHSHPPAKTAVRTPCHEPPVGLERQGHHSHECSGADCTFIAERVRLVTNVEEASHLPSLAVLTLDHAAAASRVARFASRTAPELAWGSLPRTHLALQVLQL